MHIKDHSAAMKFFRTYDNVASKGKWKEFVNEMEFDSVVQEPRTMAHGGRPGYQSGQLVQPGPGRQGYGGKGGSDPTYRANLLENLPDGYLEDYKANFYNTIEDGKLTHRGGAQPPSVKGSLKKGIPFMMEKYGKSHGKIADTNSALKASFQSQIESGAKMGYDIRIGQLRAVAPWNPKAPPGMETHHFLPKVPMEGSSINFASTRNTAFISKELNRKMSPYDKKLKAIQLEQIKLLKEKKPDWEKKINELNFKAKNIYKDAAKNVPDSKGYLGYSQMKIKPDGTYTVEITGLDSSLSLSGKDPKKEIFYRDPKTFEPISREDKLKVNEMSNIKSNKNIPKIVKQTELVSFPANFKDVKWGKNLKGWRGGTLFEVLFGTLDYWNEKSKGKEGGWGSQSMATAIQNASFGLLKTGDKKYEHELIKLGKEMGFDTTALEHVIDINKRDNVLAKVKAKNASHLEKFKKMIDEETDPEIKERQQEIYNERKMLFSREERLRTEDTNKIFDTFVEDLRATKAGPPQLVSPEKLAATGITQEEANAPFKNIWTTATEQLKREKTKAFPEASKRLNYETGVVGDPLETYIFNKDAWKKEHELFGYWNKTPKQEERAHLDSLIKLAEEGNPEPLKEYNLRERGVTQEQPVTKKSLINLTEQYPLLGYRVKEAKGGRVSFSGGGIDKGRRALLKLLAALGIGTATVGTGVIKLGGKAATKTAVKTGVDIVSSTPGMPDWFVPLVNRIIKEGDDVTAKIATKDRQVVHTKKIDTGSASPDDVTIYRDLDTGDIRVEVDSVSNMGGHPIQLDYKAPSVIDSGKSAGKKTKSEFSAVESEPRVTNWEGDIEMDGENIVGNVDDLFSDTTKVKNYAKGEKPTMKDIVTRKRKTDKIEDIHKNPSEQLDYVENKGGYMEIDDILDEGARVGDFEPKSGSFGKGVNLPDKKIKKASGGRVSYFDGGIVSLKKKW